jgi:hypothetical protein
LQVYDLGGLDKFHAEGDDSGIRTVHLEPSADNWDSDAEAILLERFIANAEMM